MADAKLVIEIKDDGAVVGRSGSVAVTKPGGAPASAGAPSNRPTAPEGQIAPWFTDEEAAYYREHGKFPEGSPAAAAVSGRPTAPAESSVHEPAWEPAGSMPGGSSAGGYLSRLLSEGKVAAPPGADEAGSMESSMVELIDRMAGGSMGDSWADWQKPQSWRQGEEPQGEAGLPPSWRIDAPPDADGGDRGELSDTPALGRPVPVIIMGPRPLPVMMVAGSAGPDTGSAGSTGAAPEADAASGGSGWGKWAVNRVSANAGTVGQMGAGLAQNNSGAVAGGAMSLLEGGLSKLGPYGMAAAAGLEAVGKVAQAASDTVKAFVARGRELSGYNGALAGATAGADVRKLQSDLREAEQLGPQMARLIENQSKGEAALSELLRPIKSFLLDVLNKLIENIIRIGVGVLEGIEAMLPAFVSIQGTIDEIKRILADDGSADLEKMVDEFIRAPIGGAPALAAPGPAAFPMPAI